jgi:hypothetical protein
MIEFILVIFLWVLCGVLAYGYALAYDQLAYPTIFCERVYNYMKKSRMYRESIGTPERLYTEALLWHIFKVILGPVGLIYILLDGRTGYGWHCKRIDQKIIEVELLKQNGLPGERLLGKIREMEGGK